jgi:hypothetical protein
MARRVWSCVRLRESLLRLCWKMKVSSLSLARKE